MSKKIEIDYIISIVSKNGWKCLSTDYQNIKAILKFECPNNHIVEKSWQTVKKSFHCSECMKDVFYNIVRTKEGICLDNYLGRFIKNKLKCKYDHIWQPTPNAILAGSWCPTCCDGYTEQVCREYFENIFNKPFPKLRPKWLRGIKNGQMELDGYCEELGVAFEHNGRQHYMKSEIFHKSEENLKYQIELDKLKYKLCVEHEVKLIVVPEINVFLQLSDLKDFISRKCIELNIKIAKESFNVNIRIKDFYSNFNYKRFELLKEIAVSKDGKCLSVQYVNAHTKMKWQCNKCNHIWDAVADSVFRGSWCPSCSNNLPLSIEEAKKIAFSRNGECLSTQIKNNAEKLIWKCNLCQNIWKASFGNILSSRGGGTWCPQCAQKKKGIKGPRKKGIII